MSYFTRASRFIFQHVENPESTLQQFVSGFCFSVISHVRVSEKTILFHVMRAT